MQKRKYTSTFIRIVTGLVFVAGSVFLIQWLSGFFPQAPGANNDLYNLAIAIIQCILAVWCYILVYRYLEKRPIDELNGASFFKNALPGILTGIALQSVIVLILFFAGGYTITRINPASFMIPAFTTALSAGFVAEIIIRGILFRLIEERLGTLIAISIMMLLFVVLHLGGKDVSVLSVMAVSIQAGFLLSAAYVLTRKLWFPIFLHFGWDFAEPGIFGAINPGNSIEASLFTCQVSGPYLLTGGSQGPVNSIQSLILCALLGLFFLWLARKKENFIFPIWRKVKV